MGSWKSRQASDGFLGASDNTKATKAERRDFDDDGANCRISRAAHGFWMSQGPLENAPSFLMKNGQTE